MDFSIGASASSFTLEFDEAVAVMRSCRYFFGGHEDGLADGGLDLGVVAGAFAVGVGVVDEDDGSGAFGYAFEGGDEFSDGSGVSGLAFADCGVEGVDDDDAVAALFDEEVFDGFEALGRVDGLGFDVEIEVGACGDVGVAVDGGEDFAGGVVVAEVTDGSLFHLKSAEGFALGDGFSEGYGDGGFSDFWRSGEEDEAVFDEEFLVSVGAAVGLEAFGFDLVEGVGDGE